MTHATDKMKQQAATAALAYIEDDQIVGVGTGSTVAFFIKALASIRHQVEGVVSSSEDSTAKLKAAGFQVLDLNSVAKVHVYVDGADEANAHLQLIKGGGGALTREKVIASAADRFICIADANKKVDVLGRFPLAVEVLPMARSYVGRELVKLGGDPVYRQNFVTDNGNVILDVHNLEIREPMKLESAINNITGVVCHGLFATRPADVLLLGSASGVETVTAS